MMDTVKVHDDKWCPICGRSFTTVRRCKQHMDRHERGRVAASIDKNKTISPIEERLISVLKDHGPRDRDQLVALMHVPRTSVFDGLKKLINRGEVKKYPFYKPSRPRGRPRVMFVLLDDRK